MARRFVFRKWAIPSSGDQAPPSPNAGRGYEMLAISAHSCRGGYWCPPGFPRTMLAISPREGTRPSATMWWAREEGGDGEKASTRAAWSLPRWGFAIMQWEPAALAIPINRSIRGISVSRIRGSRNSRRWSPSRSTCVRPQEPLSLGRHSCRRVLRSSSGKRRGRQP